MVLTMPHCVVIFLYFAVLDINPCWSCIQMHRKIVCNIIPKAKLALDAFVNHMSK
jgi:hypothetical protein